MQCHFNGAAPARARSRLFVQLHSPPHPPHFNGAAPARARSPRRSLPPSTRTPPLQWGRARAGAESWHFRPNKRLQRITSMGPRPRGRGVLFPGDPVKGQPEHFNGAAPARARSLSSALRTGPGLKPLQWGRARAGAESCQNQSKYPAGRLLQWGRARAGAESAARASLMESLAAYFNGAAPARARSHCPTPPARSSCHYFNGAAPARARSRSRPSPILSLPFHFNGAAPARARSRLCCYSLWRKLAILQSRLLALFGLLSCSCCFVGSSLSFSIRRFRHASGSRVFRITSPLAGSVVKDHQRLKPHNTARRASCRAIQAR